MTVNQSLFNDVMYLSGPLHCRGQNCLRKQGAETHCLKPLPTEYKMGKTSLHSSFTSVNIGRNTMGKAVILMYTVPGGPKDPNFGFVSVPGGYEARFRATSKSGEVFGHDSKIIPPEDYKRLGNPSGSTSGESYKVKLPSNDVDLSQYF